MSFALAVHLAFWCALIPALLFCWNLLLYRQPPLASEDATLPRISVLIPARNEERNISDAIKSVLASTGVDLELIVLDDNSTDRTAAILHNFTTLEPRLRHVSGPPLPPGWAGKAHACHVLASYGKHDIYCFLDADVRLAPTALLRMAAFVRQSRAALVSGFPREETVTPLEWLLLPLIHFLLLGYLPLAGMRAFPRVPGYAAGCGQFLMLRRDAYRQTGGYSSIRTTMHDGMTLSKLFRKHGYSTDLADLTHLARCRMYRSAAEVWSGLVKNATEVLAAPARIVPFTVLLFCGQVLPWLLLAFALWHPVLLVPRKELGAALAASLLPRALCVWRFRQRAVSAALHPAAIVVALALQWYSLGRKLLGFQVTWKERAFRVG